MRRMNEPGPHAAEFERWTMKSERITTMATIDEIGPNQSQGLEIAITWELTPAEPMVRYYPDGSGYPGSPATAEPIEVEVTAWWGPNWVFLRRHPHKTAPEMFAAQFEVLFFGPHLLDSWTDYACRRVEGDLFESLSLEAWEEANARAEYNAETWLEARRDAQMGEY